MRLQHVSAGKVVVCGILGIPHFEGLVFSGATFGVTFGVTWGDFPKARESRYLENPTARTFHT